MKNSPMDLCPIATIQTIPASNFKRNQASASSSHNPDMVEAAFGTQFTIVKASEVLTPASSSASSLRSSITGVSSFEVLGQLQTPFRVNIAGILVDISVLQPTTAGNGKSIRTLTLSDPTGCQLSIRQLGSGPGDVDIELGSKVVVYFVSGNKAWKTGEAGSLWAYEDSFIKVGSMAQFVPGFMKDAAIRPE